jgi:hypothetical protein
MFINSVLIGDENEIFLATSLDSIYISSNGGETFRTLGTARGSNDFYKFDSNSFIYLGATSDKSSFTNDGGQTWQDCHPSGAVFKIGGVYGNNFYALGKGKFYTVAIDDLDLVTSSPNILVKNELDILYGPASVELVSHGKNIDRCLVYSITGRLITITEPASTRYEFQKNSFKPGIYILSTWVNGQLFNNKVVF